jgi:AcrR family transcriptional regulator
MIEHYDGGVPAAGAGRETREAILDAAERLFAAGGVQGVSVRKVLVEAGVNTALAHYHFGGRDGLIWEVLRRRVEPLNARRLELLAEVEAAAGSGGVTLQAGLRAFFAPLVDLLDEHPDFARLLGQLHVAADRTLHEVFIRLFGDVVGRFARVLKPALPPELSGPQRACRTHFVLGAMILTVANYDDMALMTRGRFKPPRGEALLREMVAFCRAGLTAPAADDEVAG